MVDTRDEAIRNVLMMAKDNGYRVFECVVRRGASYGWMITPSGNLLYIQTGHWGYGFDISLLYVHTVKNGSGCRCNEETLTSVDLDTLKAMENAGLAFAKQLKAQLYTERQVNEYFDDYWGNVIEL